LRGRWYFRVIAAARPSFVHSSRPFHPAFEKVPRGNQQPCEHLCYAYYLSDSLVVDFSWLNPAFNDPEACEFLAEVVHNPSLLRGLATPFTIVDKDIFFAKGLRKEL
jgi:hypothetical protein